MHCTHTILNHFECGSVQTRTDAEFVLKDSLGEVPLFHEDENAFSEKKSNIKWVGKTQTKETDCLTLSCIL